MRLVVLIFSIEQLVDSVVALFDEHIVLTLSCNSLLDVSCQHHCLHLVEPFKSLA